MNKVSIELMNGKKMIVELYEDIAPITVKNFLSLVDKGFYNGTIFHRIIKDFMCQGGGYYISGNQVEHKEAESIKGEFNSNGFKNDLHHELGVISMARTSDKNSASSQFFLCVDNVYHLDNEYAGFGKITDPDSLKVLKELNSLPTAALDFYTRDFPDTEEVNFTIKEMKRI